MPDNYDDLNFDDLKDDLKRRHFELSEGLKKIREEIENDELGGVKFLSSVRRDLNRVESHNEEAGKKLSDADKEKASKKIRKLRKKAIHHLDKAILQEMRLRRTVPYQKACGAFASFKGFEDLAKDNILNYLEHKENFGKIKKFVENGKGLTQLQVDRDRKQLQEFFDDYERCKEEFLAARRREEKAIRLQKAHVWQSRVAIALAIASLVVSIIYGGHSNNVVEIFWMP